MLHLTINIIEIKKNDIVKLCKPEQGEEHLIYIVKEVNDNKALITCINVNMTIHPTELVLIKDIICINF